MQIERDFIYVSLSSEQATKLNAVWNQKRKAYRVPNTIGALRELHGLGYDVAEYGSNKRIARDKLVSLKKLDDAPGDERLRSYQKVDVNFLKRLPSAAIFNEQRTGEQI